jgi:vacuolar-type H+-ATPase subunit E/Vma4
MIRRVMVGSGLLAAVAIAVGCDGNNPTADAAKRADKSAKEAKANVQKALDEAKAAAGDAAQGAADKGKEMAKEAADKLRDAVVKPAADFLPKAEEKIKALTGDALAKAKAKYDDLKKLVDEFKAAPAEKVGELKDKVIAAVKELAGLVGLTAPTFGG